MNARLRADLYAAGITSPHLLAHYIDHATLSAGHRRKRKNRITTGEKFAIAFVAALAVAFIIGAL